MSAEKPKAVKWRRKIITMYKKLFLILTFSFVLIAAEAQTKKIVVQPQETKIYIDGNYVGDGVYTLKFTRQDDFFSVKLELPGYVTKNVKVFRQDTRKTISYTMVEDDSVIGSSSSSLANKYFTVVVRDGLDEDNAWKILNQVLLNYFDEIQTSDKSSGFINTPWVVHTFPVSEVKVRTRVQIKQVTNEGLAYQIRVSSEISPLNSKDYNYKAWDRVLKQYEPIINEMQQRLAKK